MTTNFSSKDGFITEKLKAYYAEQVLGGARLVMVKESCVDAPVGTGGVHQLYINDEKQIPGLSELASTIQNHGANKRGSIHS